MSQSYKVIYLKEIYGPLNEKPKKGSMALTALSCGHPLKLVSEKTENGLTWARVKAGLHEGYVQKRFISQDRPQCFQDQYFRFFESIDLSVTNFYFWAKLYDNYIVNTSRPYGK